MFAKKMTLDDVLRERGITDPEAYLEAKEKAPQRSKTALTELRGSIHLMLNRTVTRKEVDRRFSSLRLF